LPSLMLPRLPDSPSLLVTFFHHEFILASSSLCALSFFSPASLLGRRFLQNEGGLVSSGVSRASESSEARMEQEKDSNTLKFDNEYSRLIGAIGKAALVSDATAPPRPLMEEACVHAWRLLKKKKKTKQEKLQSNNVLVVGMKGLGLEIAKNIVLMGVKHLTIADSAPVQLRDLSSNFFLSEADVGKPRALAVRAKLQELNDRCELKLHEGPVTEELVAQFRVVGTFVVCVSGELHSDRSFFLR
jgi:hypothetical protein